MTARRPRPLEQGSAAVSSIVAVGLLLLFVTLLTQFAVWQYGRGALRSAALEAARAGSPLDASSSDCLHRFETVRASLLAGRLGDQVGEVVCDITGDRVVVAVDAQFERWLPLSPDWHFTVRVVAVREVAPT